MHFFLLHGNWSFELKAYPRDLTPLSDMAVLRRAKFKISIMTRNCQWLLSAGLLTAWSGLPCQSLNFAHHNLLCFLSSFSALNPLNWFWMGDMIVRTPCSNTSTLDTWHLPPLQNGHHSSLHVKMWFVNTSNNERRTPIPSARCTILLSAPHSFNMFANRSTIANPWLGRHCAQNTKGQEIKQPNCKLLRPFYLSCVFNSRTFIFVPCLQLISIGPVFSYFRCFRGHVDCQTTWPLGSRWLSNNYTRRITNYMQWSGTCRNKDRSLTTLMHSQMHFFLLHGNWSFELKAYPRERTCPKIHNRIHT